MTTDSDDPRTLVSTAWLAAHLNDPDLRILDASWHMPATGRDARGRKQYRYHPRFREVRDSAKYDRMLAFARVLPGLRARVDADMARRGMGREKVLATVVHLLETTMIRVGNADYVKQNKSHGLTTLRDRHVKVEGTEVRFRFKGKSGKTWDLGLRDRRVARIVRQSQELPGQHLFQYLDDTGAQREVTSGDVNAYLREITGEGITAKDFRTWTGTVLAALALADTDPRLRGQFDQHLHTRVAPAFGQPYLLDALGMMAQQRFHGVQAIDLFQLTHDLALRFLGPPLEAGDFSAGLPADFGLDAPDLDLLPPALSALPLRPPVPDWPWGWLRNCLTICGLKRESHGTSYGRHGARHRVTWAGDRGCDWSGRGRPECWAGGACPGNRGWCSMCSPTGGLRCGTSLGG